jgi:hypothetical protein
MLMTQKQTVRGAGSNPRPWAPEAEMRDSGCCRGIYEPLFLMGAKYLPTDKDMKASKRFHQKQHVQSKFIKPAAPKPAKKPKK